MADLSIPYLREDGLIVQMVYQTKVYARALPEDFPCVTCEATDDLVGCWKHDHECYDCFEVNHGMALPSTEPEQMVAMRWDRSLNCWVTDNSLAEAFDRAKEEAKAEFALASGVGESWAQGFQEGMAEVTGKARVTKL